VSPREIYQLKVRLLEIEPPIWRRLQVRGSTTLSKLHAILQDLAGWTNSHLYSFDVAGKSYEEPDPEAEGANARKTQLARLGLQVGNRFEYLYDFGDYWAHEVLLEEILPPDPDTVYPLCLDGARAWPPEDSGGPPGYDAILEALQNPSDASSGETLEWLPRGYDPEIFDLRATNRILELAHGRGAT
jgi:hypothetical protein